MTKLFQKNIILILIITVAAFFYIFRIHQTFYMASDTVRDLVQVLTVWQNKELTLIGPPVNTISNSPILLYSGSMHYYFGLFGLILTNFDPIGSIFANILLTLISIPFFYVLAKEILKKKKLALVSTFIYALSPLTISLTRSYWNPNLVIPLSVFAWYCFLYKPSRLKYFVAGVLSGIVFNLHYVNFIVLGFYFILLLLKKDKRAFWLTVAGFVFASLPLIAFEIKHQFYLTGALFINRGGFLAFTNRFANPLIPFEIILYIFGLGTAELYVPGQILVPLNFRIGIDLITGAAFLFLLFRNRKSLGKEFTLIVIAGLAVSWFFGSTDILYVRYALSTLPLMIISIVSVMNTLNPYLVIVPLIPMLMLSTEIVTHTLNPNVREEYIPLSSIEKISGAIVADNPTGRYNVTENILGDARSLAFRYYLLRDAKVKPQSVEVYDSIDTLYVITPSLDRTYQEDRWEFSASGPKKIEWEKDFGDLKLFKFIK